MKTLVGIIFWIMAGLASFILVQQARAADPLATLEQSSGQVIEVYNDADAQVLIVRYRGQVGSILNVPYAQAKVNSDEALRFYCPTIDEPTWAQRMACSDVD